MFSPNRLSHIVIAFLIIICAWYGKNLKKWESNGIIDQDVTQYYAYFPATFIYHDWNFNFVKDLPEDFTGRIWLQNTEDGRPFLKMTMGLSVLWSPFELIAHIYAKNSSFDADGYSVPYSVAIFMANLFYLFVGLFFLNKILRIFFDGYVVAIVLFLLVVGTNLMHYVIAEPGMSHVFSFSLISLFIYLSDRWLRSASFLSSLMLGITFGLIVLVRPTNAVVIVIPLLWDLKNLKERIAFLTINWKFLLVMIFMVLLVIFPQLLYWKIATDHWFYYSYNREGFFFNNPQIINGLFSYRKGWMVYTPIMFVSLAGFFVLPKYVKHSFFAVLTTTIIAIYIVYSWWAWWYGGSYGSRPMIDYYAVVAFALAAIISELKKYGRIPRVLLAIVFGFFIFLNQFQMNQYRTSLLHWDSMTKEAYWAIMFKKNWPENYQKLIHTPDYEKALKGEKEY